MPLPVGDNQQQCSPNVEFHVAVHMWLRGRHGSDSGPSPYSILHSVLYGGTPYCAGHIFPWLPCRSAIQKHPQWCLYIGRYWWFYPCNPFNTFKLNSSASAVPLIVSKHYNNFLSILFWQSWMTISLAGRPRTLHVSPVWVYVKGNSRNACNQVKAIKLTISPAALCPAREWTRQIIICCCKEIIGPCASCVY